MLNCCSNHHNHFSTRELMKESIQLLCKLPSSNSQVKYMSCLGFNHLFCPTHVKRTSLLHSQKQIRTRVSLGFKLQCHSSATLDLSPKKFVFNGKKKKYGGVLPSVLRSLESENDIEKALVSVCENLTPKEQTVVLKEQKNWERVVRVFEFFKSRNGYVPNVIHYNVVLRALGRTQKWDELRLRWIEMANSGILPTNNTYAMLVDVYGKAGLVAEALLWIKHMRLRGMFPDEVTMNTVVRVLKDVGEFDRAISFYKGWCAGHVELDSLEMDSMVDLDNSSESSRPVCFKHFLLTELFKTRGRNPSFVATTLSDEQNRVGKPHFTSTYNTLLDLYGKAGHLKDATDVFAEMLRSGVAPDTITFNTMIFTCGTHGYLSEAEMLLSKMEERGISPDTKTYNIFISLYADAGRVEDAMDCYKKIREVGLRPDVVSHRAMLHVLCKRTMISEVESVLETMEKFSEKIDDHSLPVIIQMYVNEGMFDKAKNLLTKCQLKGKLSSKIRAAIMDVYAEKGLWTDAEDLFYGRIVSLVQKRGVLEYNVLIKAYGKGGLYDNALSLFRSMRNQGTWPDECTYNSLIQMFSGANLVDQARSLLGEMQGAGLKPHCQTFSSVIASYARLEQLSDAAALFQEMANAGVKPNEVVYGSLINGFAEYGNVEEALQYFHEMEESGLVANQIVLTCLIKVYCKLGRIDGAKQLYQKIKDLEGNPDVIASNTMINLYADLGMVSEAEFIFSSLRRNGSADGVSFTTMMYLYKSMGMLDKAIDVAEGMKQSCLLSNTASYNKVMSCYATNSQLRVCGELLHEMIKQKLPPDGGTFNILFTVLKKGGIPSEAITQLWMAYDNGKPYAGEAVVTSVFSAVGLHALAVEFYENFIKAGSSLDSFVYNVAIYAYGSSGDISKALNKFMKMQDEGLEADLVTYIHLVLCYGKAGMIEGVKRIYTQMKNGDIKANDSLFKAIIDAYKVANRHDLAELVSQAMRLGIETELDSYSDGQQNSESEQNSAA